MASMEGCNTFQGRIETFVVEHYVAKRRASSARGKKAASTVAWPHLNPLPNDLARAGFFYKPTSGAEDNCECYLCHVKLDGWESGDDPVEEHLKHSPGCGWAQSASLQRKFNSGESVDADPMSQEFVDARTMTFGDSWPYENRKGWKPKVAKMVAAGWTYDPSPEYDDGVTCMYCNLSLDGWEPKDDPFAEHQKRCPDCPFFSLVEDWASARQQAKKVKGKGRTSRASKGSRLSTQSVVSVASEAPSLDLGDLDELAAMDESVMSTATTTSTTGKGRKKAAAKGTKTGGRGKKATASQDDSVTDIDPPTIIEASTVSEAPAKATRKASRTKKAPVVEEPSAMDVDLPAEVEYPTIIESQEPPKRQTRRKVSKQEPPSQIEDVLSQSQAKKPARGKAAAKTKQQARMSDDESQLHMELQQAVESSIISTAQPGRSTRGTKRTSDGVPKITSSVIMLDHEPIDFQEQAAKPKRGRKPKTTASRVESDDTQPRSSDASEVPQRVSSIPKAGPKSRKGKKAAKVAEPSPEPELEVEVELPQEVQDDDAQMEDALDALDAENDDFDFAASLANPSNPYAPITGTPDHGPGETSPAPSSPTPARARNTTPTHALPALPMFSIKKTPAKRTSTPEGSPNSSDAENKPPSSRPASVRPPLSVQRIPLAPSSPNKAPLSPSKRMIGGGLTSSLPWSPAKLTDIFLNSPVKANLGLDKETALAMPGVDIEHLGGRDNKALHAVVKKVKDVMRPEEKKMSVEQWVRWNAEQGEERLRRECESLVMMFEKEGGRALRTLEGVECLQ